MKVYIPFNSHDFNNVFSTLSISPIAFYSQRNYGFTRGTHTLLNKNANFLVGYEKPFFHNSDYDIEEGNPILLEVNVEISKSKFKTADNGFRYVILDQTIYFFNDFKLFFRNEEEQRRSHIGMVKGMENKYAHLAIKNSIVDKDITYLEQQQLPSIEFPQRNLKINSSTFELERTLDRILGTIMCSSIGSKKTIHPEWVNIEVKLQHLINFISAYLNSLNDTNSKTNKKRALYILKELEESYHKIESPDDALQNNLDKSASNKSFINRIFKSDFKLIDLIKNIKLFGKTIYEWMIKGMLSEPNEQVPLTLKLQLLEQSIETKFSSNNPQSYIRNINEHLDAVAKHISHASQNSIDANTIIDKTLVKPLISEEKLDFLIPSNLSTEEELYLKKTLAYFVTQSKFDMSRVDNFFENREKILIDLGYYFLEEVTGFKNSKEQKYFGILFNSFKNPAIVFEPKLSNDVFTSLGILFTTGRDLSQYISNNKKADVHNPLIYYSIWGAIYGIAKFPKTETEIITQDKESTNLILDALKEAANSFFNNYTIEHAPEPKKAVTVVESIIQEPKPERGKDKQGTANKVQPKMTTPISELSDKSEYILKQLAENDGKIKLSKIKTKFKFKNHSPIKAIINDELSDKVSVKKIKGTEYALIKDANFQYSINLQ